MHKLLLPILSLLSASVLAQSFGPSPAQLSLVKKGAESYSNQKWLCAIKSYEKAIDLNEGSVALDGVSMATATLNLAKSYEKIGNRKKSANWYEKAKAYNTQNKEIIFAYARSLQAANRDADAIKVFDEYVQKGGDANKARPFMEIINKRVLGSYLIKGAEVKPLKLRGDLSCYSPAFNGNSIVFTSPAKKEPLSNKPNNCKAYRTNIFQAKQKMNGDFGVPESFCNCVSSKKFNDGPATLDRSNSVIYFTRQILVKNKEGKTQMRSRIYQVNVACENGASPQALSFTKSESNFGYAAFNQAGDILYFASDMPGGYGGMDLYRVSVHDTSFGKPENLGSVINTSDDEIAPFISKEGKLFFASNGHPGIGGMDIFSADTDASGKYTRVSNLKEPVNSPYEDFGFTIHPQLGNFFSSNRNGQYNIFKLNANNLIQQSLEFRVTDASTKTALGDVHVSLISEVSKKGEILFSLTDGKVLFENVLPGIYTLKAEKSGYVSSVQSIDANTGKTILSDIKLNPERSLRGKVIDNTSKVAITNAEVQYILENGKDGFVTHTDAAGLYAFERLNFANGKVLARAEGYNEFSFSSGEFTAKGGTIELLSSNTKPEKAATQIDLNPIGFTHGKYNISRSELPRLEKLGRYLQQNKNVKIEITGCTDDTGKDKININLAKKRADQVKKFLNSVGTPASNIVTKTSVKLPIDANCKGNKTCMEKSRKENRKVELRLVK